jgi:DNA-binding CsgD family transcriptional regulator
VPNASFALLGFGVVQTWMLVMMTVSGMKTSSTYNESLLVLDIGSMPAYLLFLFAASRITPLLGKRWPIPVAVIIMLVGDVLVAAGALIPSLPNIVSTIGLFVAGFGSASMIVCWWEVYGVLSPAEVALYYTGSWILREVLVLLLAGYNISYLLAVSLFLPLIAAAMLIQGARKIESALLSPKIIHHSASFPWKPMLLVGLYGFVYGCGTWLASYSDNLYMHLGIILPSILVCASVLFSYRRFNFSTIYRFILPAAAVGSLALLMAPSINEDVATLLIRASYSSIFIYVSVLLCNLSRRYFISAAWLFSLFNITHIVCLGLGTLMFYALSNLIIVGVCIVCIALVTFIIISEPSLSSGWQIVLAGKGGPLDEQAYGELEVVKLARKYGLSSREQEIMLLLTQRSLPRSIGRELHIAPGTVKAHIQHIYKKTGVHSKEELIALLDD